MMIVSILQQLIPSIEELQEMMQDEYGCMDASGRYYKVERFELESGHYIQDAETCYNTFGTLNEDKDNVLVVCHALTGNSRLDQWWGNMLGTGKVFDTSKYFVICCNVLGSCYGTTGPASTNPATNKLYGNTFPEVTIRDTVRLHLKVLKEDIGARSIKCVIGGSLGGMQALEWVLEGGPQFVRSAVIIACGASHSAWQISQGEIQRQAIYLDPKWNHGDVDMADPPKKGLAVARQIAMTSYRTPAAYDIKFGRSRAIDDDGKMGPGDWQAKVYLHYQEGLKFIERFDAVTYVKLTEQMDTHDIGRGRGGVDSALASVAVKTLIMGIESDLLYPLTQQQEMAAKIKDSMFHIIRSTDGHDGFLLEQTQVSKSIQSFLDSITFENLQC